MKRLALTASAALFLLASACSGSSAPQSSGGLVQTGSMELKYAEQFSVDYFEGGYSLVTIGDDRFLIVPESAPVPADTEGMTVLHQPLEHLYVAATSAMDLFDGIGKLPEVTMTSTDVSGWSLPHVCEALASGDLTYIGKYSSPDYESIIAGDCGLALESTMIYHTPEVREQLEAFGIPVMVERSSYESHPLGRLEWIRLYGLLMGNSDEAEALFAEKSASLEALPVPDGENRKTAAFFYISSNGYINIRKPGDYVSKMIELAGGQYIFTADDLNVDDNALSTMNIQAETFYSIARDADILIYNSTIGGEPESTAELIEKCDILRDFKAFREGNVWCTGQNMFQQTTGAAEMICDLNQVFSGDDAAPLTYLHHLD